MNKKLFILVAILTGVFCGGCATFTKIDRIPYGAPKGYVEFQKYDPDDVGKTVPVIDMASPTVGASHEIICDFFLNDIIRIAVTPGVHRYGVDSCEGSSQLVEINVIEGMVTYVIVKLTRAGISSVNTVIQHNGWGYTYTEPMWSNSIFSAKTVSIEEADKRIERIKKAKTKQERKEALNEILW